MRHAHPNRRRWRRTPPASCEGRPPLLRLVASGDTPGWQLGDDEAGGRPLTVTQAVEHAAGVAGPSGTVQVLDATRAVLDALPPGHAAQLGAELTTAAAAVLSDVRGGLDALGAVLDGVDRATTADSTPDVLATLTAQVEQGRARTTRLRVRVDAPGGPMGAMLAALGADA